MELEQPFSAHTFETTCCLLYKKPPAISVEVILGSGTSISLEINLDIRFIHKAQTFHQAPGGLSSRASAHGNTLILAAPSRFLRGFMVLGD